MNDVLVYLVLSLPLAGAFAMFALGVVVIYRASRVLNLAHGAMAMVPAYLAFEMSRLGLPIAVAFPFGVTAGMLLGLAAERLFVRPLGRQSATAQTVGTVAVLGLLVAISVKVWGTTPRSAPGVFPDGGFRIEASLLRYGQIGIIVIAALASVGLFVLMQRTEIGLLMRGAADNRVAASLMGVDPNRTTQIAWAIGGGLAATAGILLAPVTSLHPYNLSLLVLPGFVAALIGGLGSLHGALIGAAIVGLTQGMVPAFRLIPGIGSLATQVGVPQLVLTIVAFIVMYARGERFVGAPASQNAPHGEAEEPDRRFRLSTPAKIVLGIALLSWPLVGAPFSLLGDAIQAAILTIVGVSTVVLTGWVGQISLGQAAFVGIGAFTTGLLAREAHVSFPASVPLAALIAAAAATLLGVIALRVRGLYLAVATLIFLWMANEYLFRASWLVGVGGSSSIEPQQIGEPGRIPFFDLTDRRTFYYVALALTAAVLWGVANLRDSKTGRAFFAVRGSEVAAASLGIDVTRTKLFAFAFSGLLAGIAGNLIMVGRGAASTSQFGFDTSLFYLAVPVVGGLTSLGGAVAAAVVFAGLNELFFRVPALGGWLDVVSASLLALVLLAYPGGLAALCRRVGALASVPLDAIGRRLPKAPALGVPAFLRRPGRTTRERTLSAQVAEPSNRIEPTIRETRGGARSALPVVLETEGVTVQFGGVRALDDVAIDVRKGEIVGLIGPNGAGKTTLFNVLSGLLPAAGVVRMFGTDVTDWPSHRRAALGVGRTFQLLQLFPQLTVFENMLVATHLRNGTSPLSHLFVTKRALTAEGEAREHVREVAALLKLEEIMDRRCAGLPFGVLRRVEVARALVTRAALILLDEPASGLDNAETDRLAELLISVRDSLDASLLLVEHDVRMVTSVSDYMYVLDRGHLLAQGTARQVQADERVVASYLGRAPMPAPRGAIFSNVDPATSKR